MATIYNKSSFSIQEKEPLLFEKGTSVIQFGMIIRFMQLENKNSFLNINVHLNGGKTPKDKDIRDKQLEVLLKKL